MPVKQGDMQSGISRATNLSAGVLSLAERLLEAASCGSDCGQPVRILPLFHCFSFSPIKQPPPRSVVSPQVLPALLFLRHVACALQCLTSFKELWQNVSALIPPPPFGQLVLSLS